MSYSGQQGPAPLFAVGRNPNCYPKKLSGVPRPSRTPAHLLVFLGGEVSTVEKRVLPLRALVLRMLTSWLKYYYSHSHFADEDARAQ